MRALRDPRYGWPTPSTLAVHHINSPSHPRPLDEGFRRGEPARPPPATASRTEKPQLIPRRRPARGHGVAARHPPRRQHHLRPLGPPRIRKPASVPFSYSSPPRRSSHTRRATARAGARMRCPKALPPDSPFAEGVRLPPAPRRAVAA